jgi:hypothetical protein
MRGARSRLGEDRFTCRDAECVSIFHRLTNEHVEAILAKAGSRSGARRLRRFIVRSANAQIFSDAQS